MVLGRDAWFIQFIRTWPCFPNGTRSPHISRRTEFVAGYDTQTFDTKPQNWKFQLETHLLVVVLQGHPSKK